MLENPLLAGAVLGGLGGLIRAIVGVWKACRKGDHFHASYFFVTVGVAVLIGLGLSLSLEGNGYVKPILFLGGYGGTDFLESLTKIVLKK